MHITEARYLARSAHCAPSADNSQPWRFVFDGESLFVHFDAARIAGKSFSQDNPATLLSLGALLENIDHSINLQSLEAEVEIAEDELGPEGFLAKIVSSGGPPPLKFADDSPVTLRHTNRFPYKKNQGAPLEILSHIEAMEINSSRLKMYSGKSLIDKITLLVRRASEIRFQTQEVHEMLATSLRFSSDPQILADGMDVRTLHLPPGGALFLRFTSDWKRMNFLNRFGAYKFMAAVDSKLLAEAPLIIAVTGSRDRQGAMDAGRILCRTWTYLNANGLAVHPYFVITDQIHRLQNEDVPLNLVPLAQECSEETAAFFGLANDESLYMLLRVGYPSRIPNKSLRLPFEQVFSDLSINSCA